MPLARQNSLLHRTGLCAGAAVAVLGSAMVVLWLSGIAAADFAPWLFQMKVNTALGLVLAGCGVMVAAEHRKSHAVAIGAMLAALGALTLLQYLTGVSLGIDEMLLRDFHFPNHQYPGRISPSTASALRGSRGAAAVLAAR